MPKVSVVIPAYNVGSFITETIQSVLAQSFRDFETIIIDDGSTDNTAEIIASFPVRYMYQENQGPPSARNKGIELARGEYIAFLDSDDIWVENALEKRVEALDKHPEVAFSYGQAYHIDENCQTLRLFKPPHNYSRVREGRDVIQEMLIHGNLVILSSIMVRRSCLDEVGLFDLNYRAGSEDLDLWVRLAKRYAIAYIAEPLVKYRLHSQSVSSNREVDEIEKTNHRIIEVIFNDVELGPLFSAQADTVYSHLNVRLAEYAYERGQMKTARGYLFKALKSHPWGYFRSFWWHWISCFAKTWMPRPILALVTSMKNRLMIAALKKI